MQARIVTMEDGSKIGLARDEEFRTMRMGHRPELGNISWDSRPNLYWIWKGGKQVHPISCKVVHTTEDHYEVGGTLISSYIVSVVLR